MREYCGLETKQGVEVAKQIAQNSSFILLTQKKKRGRMTKNENYYEQTVGNPAQNGFTVLVVHCSSVVASYEEHVGEWGD